MSARSLLQRHHGESSAQLQLDSLTLLRIRYSPLLHLPVHAHERACFCFVLDGSYQETFGSSSFACNTATTLFRPAREPHSDRFSVAGSRCLLLELESSWLDHVREDAALPDEPARQEGGAPAWLGASLLRQWKLGDEVATLAIEGLALELAAEFSRGLPSKAGIAPPRWLVRARDFLHASYNQPLNMAVISRSAGVHPVHMARAFRLHFGCTPAAYVRQQRVRHACRALGDTEAPLAQVALEAGFSHQAHFTHVFKKFTGFTPAVYRSFHRSC